MPSSTHWLRSLIPLYRRPLLTVSTESIPKSSMSSLSPSPTPTPTTHTAPLWKRPSTWIIRHRSCLFLTLSVLMILHLITLIVLFGANLAMINKAKTQRSPPPTNNGISRYLTYLKETHIPRDEIFTNRNLLPPFLDDTFTRDIQPIPCHSHNDYLRDVPLFDALNAGCSSVEADIWADPADNSTLLVGHVANKLHPARTLRSMYIDPIISILDATNPNVTGAPSGPFDTSPNTTLVLLIDFKQSPNPLWPILQYHLTPLREKGYLQYWNETTQTLTPGPVTIVASGSINENPLLVQSASTNPHHDIFLYAPLLSLSPASTSTTATTTTAPSSYNISNSYYASTALNPALSQTHFTPSLLTLPSNTNPNTVFTTHQTNTLRTQTQAAQNIGLRTRYWGTPSWPVGTRNAVWNALVRQVGVDVLNVDDVWGAARWDWSGCLVGWVGVC